MGYKMCDIVCHTLKFQTNYFHVKNEGNKNVDHTSEHISCFCNIEWGKKQKINYFNRNLIVQSIFWRYLLWRGHKNAFKPWFICNDGWDQKWNCKRCAQNGFRPFCKFPNNHLNNGTTYNKLKIGGKIPCMLHTLQEKTKEKKYNVFL